MSRSSTRLLVGVLAALAMFGLNASAANAAASPVIHSTYDFNTNLYGEHSFTVTGSGVKVEMWGTSGPAENVNINIEVQTCGFFGCHWDGSTVGGTCVRTLFVGGDAVCNFSAPASSTLHRVDMGKRTDGFTIKGNITIS